MRYAYENVCFDTKIVFWWRETFWKDHTGGKKKKKPSMYYETMTKQRQKNENIYGTPFMAPFLTLNA